MDAVEQKLEEAYSFLHDRLPFRPRTAIVLGTGLSDVADGLKRVWTLPYAEIPHFPLSTVETHAGNLLFGSWHGRNVVILQGRVHYYEGYSLPEVVFPVRLMKWMGASTLIITNASGGLDPAFSPAEIMVITDHINLIGDNPLRGPNATGLGDRFPSMHEPYTPAYVDAVSVCAKEAGIALRKGVYVAVAGPSLETVAETRFLRMIGADAVGMSTVPEVIAAVHAGMKVLGLSVIANVNIPECPVPVPLEDVVDNVRKAGPNLVKLIGSFLKHVESEPNLDH